MLTHATSDAMVYLLKPRVCDLLLVPERNFPVGLFLRHKEFCHRCICIAPQVFRNCLVRTARCLQQSRQRNHASGSKNGGVASIYGMETFMGKIMINHKNLGVPYRQTNHPVGLNFTLQLVPSFAADIPFPYACKTTRC